MKAMKIILSMTVAAVVLVVVAGFIKFYIIGGDVSVEPPDSTFVPTNTSTPTTTTQPPISEAGIAQLDDLIRVTAPRKGSPVTSPIELVGEARGTWFFEASAPVVIVDWDGRIIGEGYVTADGEWMTEDYVSFSGSVEYTLPEDVYDTRGAVILQKANPSGLPEHDAAVEIPVLFR